MCKRTQYIINYADPDTSDEESGAGISETEQPEPKRRKVSSSKSALKATSKSSAGAAKKKQVSKKQKKAEKVFDFLALPGEIRNQIYEYAFTSDQDMYIMSRKNTLTGSKISPTGPFRHRRKNLSKKKRNDTAYGLLRTCKQINKEATPFLYTQNHFEFPANQTFLDFAAWHPKAIPHLRSLRIWLKIDVASGTAFLCKDIFDTLASVPLDQFHVLVDTSALTIDCAADLFYMVAGDWMIAVGHRRGDQFAALDVLWVDMVMISYDRTCSDEKVDMFNGRLRHLLEHVDHQKQDLDHGQESENAED